MKKKDFSDQYLKRVPLILKEAASLFGPRVGKVRFGSIIYDGVIRPELDYDEFIYAIPPIRNKVNIALTPDAKTNWEKGLFQLSHEVVHLLSALAFDDDQIANNLEEGAAVYFSKIYTKKEANDEDNFNAPTAKTGYLYAYKLVKQLLDFDRKAIIRLRKVQPYFNKVSAADFKKAKININEILISELVSNFQAVMPEPPINAVGEETNKADPK